LRLKVCKALKNAMSSSHANRHVPGTSAIMSPPTLASHSRSLRPGERPSLRQSRLAPEMACASPTALSRTTPDEEVSTHFQKSNNACQYLTIPSSQPKLETSKPTALCSKPDSKHDVSYPSSQEISTRTVDPRKLCILLNGKFGIGRYEITVRQFPCEFV
jgi:hypothetical protein